MWAEEIEHIKDTLPEKTNKHLSVKIVAAEIIDVVLEVIRNLLPPELTVEPVGDNPNFPNLIETPSPYGSGTWNYTSGIYQTFAMSLWLNTISTWNQTYTREGDNTTYYSGQTIHSTGTRIVDILSSLMGVYSYLSVRKTYETPSSDEFGILLGTTETDTDGSIEVRSVRTLTCSLIYNYSQTQMSYGYQFPAFSDLYNSRVKDNIQRVLDSTGVSNINSQSSNIPAEIFESGLSGEWQNRLTPTNEFVLNFVRKPLRSHILLDYFNELFSSYADKIENYRTAITTIIESDESPIQETVNNLITAGNSGVDVLQNITPVQLVLKEISLEQEMADEVQAFIPKYSITDAGKFNALSSLLNFRSFLYPESGTTKIAIVGLPATTLTSHFENDEESYSIMISYTDSEFPQLVFKPKIYNFKRDVYVLPGGYNSITDNMLLDDVLNEIELTEYKFSIDESVDTSATISLKKTKKKMEGPDNAYAVENVKISELLKEYYQLMTGMNFNESSFPTTPSGINLVISEAATNLADNLASVIDEAVSFPESIATSIREIATTGRDLSVIDELITGNITAVDAALINGVRSAYQTRLFSPDVVRSAAISAKMFDRILAIPIDPDEFFLVTENNRLTGEKYTPSNIIESYVTSGVIEEISAGKYKLKPRTYADGTMAFGSYTASLGSFVDDGDSLLGTEV